MRRVAVKRFSPLLPEVRCQLLSEGSPVPYSGASESPCTIILPCSSGSVSSVLVTNQQLHEGSNQIICSGSVSSPSILTTDTKRGFSDQASALNRSRGYGVVSKFKLREKKKKYNYITQERLIRPSTRSTEFGRATAFFRENNESTRLYARSRKQYEEVVNRSVLLPPDIAHRVFFDHISNTRHWFKTTNMRSRPKRIKRIMGLPDDLYLKTIHGLIYRYSKQPQVKIAQQQLMKLYDLGQGFVDEGVSRNIGNDGHGLPCSPLIVNHHTDLQKHLLRDDGFNVMLSRFQQAVVAFDRQELYENNGGKVLVFNDAAYEPQSVKDGFSLVPLVQAVYANLTGSSDPLQGEDLEVLCAAFACAVAFRHHPSLPEYSSLLPKEHAAYNDLKAKRSKHSHDKLLANGYLYLFSDSYSIGKDFNELCEYLAVAPFIRGGKSLTECQYNEARSSIFLKNVLGCELLHEYQPQTTFFRQLAQEMTSQERKNIIKYVCHHRVRLTAAITAENRVLASLRVTFLTIYECRILMRDGKWMIVKALRERASGLAESSMHPVINIDSSKNRFLSPVLMPATPNALLNTIRMRNVRRRRALIRQGLTTPAQELSYDRHLLTTIHDMTVLQRASLTFPFCERIAMGEGRRTYRNPFSTFLAYRSRQMAEMFGRKIPCMSVIVLGIAKEWFALSQEEKK